VTGQELRVESERLESCRVLRLVGELDLATVEILDQHIAGFAADAGPSQLVVDLTALEFMDSTGLKSLLRASEQFPGRVALVAPSFAVRRLLDVTGLDSHFPQFPDVESARAFLDPESTSTEA
jgi:anti-anti-sigma factor